MVKRICLVIIILLTAQAANAQFNCFLLYDCTTDPGLTYQCGFTGAPLPDGTTIAQIFWDANNNGPDEADQPARIDGPVFGRANFNSMPFNSVDDLGCEGGFYSYDLFSISTNTPQPSRYWVRVCVPGQNRYWRTGAFTITDGYSEVTFHQADWTCVEEACGGCITPDAVTNFQASDNSCSQVTMTWSPYPADQSVDSLFVFRDFVYIASVSRYATSYSDLGAPLGASLYQIVARFRDPFGQVDSCFSDISSAQGSRLTPPFSVDNIEASVGLCQLTITWSDVIGENSYQILRNGQPRATVAENITGFVDDTALPTQIYAYSVIAQSQICFSDTSPEVEGSRISTPNVPVSVQATDSICDQILVSWGDTDHETGYYIKRNGTTIATVGQNVTFYADSTAGSFSYRVQAFNICGASFNSLADSGRTDIAPTMQSLQSSSPDCDGITLLFSATANADSINLYRDGGLVATVPASQGYYDDTPEPGSYVYSAIAVGDCGVSAPLGGIFGELLAYPAGPSALTAANDSCSTIHVSWSPATGDYGYYRVFRDGAELATLPNEAIFYDDEAVIGGVEYMYTVIAVNDTCGESEVVDSLHTGVTLGSAPAAPEVTITIQSLDALLTWPSIDSTLAGCPVAVSRYLVYYSQNGAGPFYYHGSTMDTSYRHVEVVRFAPSMHYHVESFAGPVQLISALPDDGSLTREDVYKEIKRMNTRERLREQNIGR